MAAIKNINLKTCVSLLWLYDGRREELEVLVIDLTNDWTQSLPPAGSLTRTTDPVCTNNSVFIAKV